MQVSQDVNGAQ